MKRERGAGLTLGGGVMEQRPHLGPSSYWQLVKFTIVPQVRSRLCNASQLLLKFDD